MLTHLDPQDPKNGKATKLHKLQGVCTDDDEEIEGTLTRRPSDGLAAHGERLRRLRTREDAKRQLTKRLRN